MTLDQLKDDVVPVDRMNPRQKGQSQKVCLLKSPISMRSNDQLLYSSYLPIWVTYGIKNNNAIPQSPLLNVHMYMSSKVI